MRTLTSRRVGYSQPRIPSPVKYVGAGLLLVVLAWMVVYGFILPMFQLAQILQRL